MSESFFRRAYSMYADGFRSMTVGRRLWAIIIIKLVILFAIFRLFFFPDLLKENYDNDKDRASAVRNALSQPRQSTDNSHQGGDGDTVPEQVTLLTKH